MSNLTMQTRPDYKYSILRIEKRGLENNKKVEDGFGTDIKTALSALPLKHKSSLSCVVLPPAFFF